MFTLYMRLYVRPVAYYMLNTDKCHKLEVPVFCCYCFCCCRAVIVVLRCAHTKPENALNKDKAQKYQRKTTSLFIDR